MRSAVRSLLYFAAVLTLRSAGPGGRSEASAAVRPEPRAARVVQGSPRALRAAGPRDGQHDGVLHPHRPCSSDLTSVVENGVLVEGSGGDHATFSCQGTASVGPDA
jgi:hypothetical protein